MKASKITTKYQATVPKEVREFLTLHAGDGLRWEIEDGKVVVHKLTKLDLEWQKSIEMTLSEWSSPEDEEAYGSL